jgi:hypothetical protein
MFTSTVTFFSPKKPLLSVNVTSPLAVLPFVGVNSATAILPAAASARPESAAADKAKQLKSSLLQQLGLDSAWLSAKDALVTTPTFGKVVHLGRMVAFMERP